MASQGRIWLKGGGGVYQFQKGYGGCWHWEAAMKAPGVSDAFRKARGAWVLVPDMAFHPAPAWGHHTRFQEKACGSVLKVEMAI